jgi:hypothetical protein
MHSGRGVPPPFARLKKDGPKKFLTEYITILNKGCETTNEQNEERSKIHMS